MDRLTLKDFGLSDYYFISAFDCIKITDIDGDRHVLAGGGLLNNYKYTVEVVPKNESRVNIERTYILQDN